MTEPSSLRVPFNSQTADSADRAGLLVYLAVATRVVENVDAVEVQNQPQGGVHTLQGANGTSSARVMVTGSGPQSKVMTPPSAMVLIDSSSVQPDCSVR